MMSVNKIYNDEINNKQIIYIDMSDFCIQKIKFNKNVKITKVKKHCRNLLGKKAIVISKSNIVVNFPTKCFIAKSYKK